MLSIDDSGVVCIKNIPSKIMDVGTQGRLVIIRLECLYLLLIDSVTELLNFRSIGQMSFELYVKERLLKEASTNAPVRMKRLCTFTTTNIHRQKIKQVEKERRLSQLFLKRQLTWAAKK